LLFGEADGRAGNDADRDPRIAERERKQEEKDEATELELKVKAKAFAIEEGEVG